MERIIRGGFVQYQLVCPGAARTGLLLIIEELGEIGALSFLPTKRFGPEGQGMLSFPMEGYTLTLDIPVRGKGLFQFLDRLDEIVLKFGGRVYLAKDARLRPESFRAMYPRFREWQRIKAKIDPENHFASELSRRLGIAPVEL